MGHRLVKNLVYRVPVNNLDTLRNRIRDAMAMVTPEMLQNVRSNLLKRARLCIQAGGGDSNTYFNFFFCEVFSRFLLLNVKLTTN
jgi:hypothetical protein